MGGGGTYENLYLDSHHINFKKLCIPGCLLVHLNILVQHRNGASTMFNNV